MIPKKGSKELMYNDGLWRYKVIHDKDGFSVIVQYSCPNNKYYRRKIMMLDPYQYLTHYGNIEFKPSDFIELIIKQYHSDTIK